MSEMTTLTCPNCGETVTSVCVQAPATVVTKAIVSAEVLLGELPEAIRAASGHRFLSSFELYDILDTVDGNDDHYGLDLDDPHLSATCDRCNADVTDAFRELL